MNSLKISPTIIVNGKSRPLSRDFFSSAICPALRYPVEYYRAGTCGKNHCARITFPGRAVRNATKLIVQPRTFYVESNLTNDRPALHGCETMVEVEGMKVNIDFSYE